jgi:hypothetical protein
MTLIQIETRIGGESSVIHIRIRRGLSVEERWIAVDSDDYAALMSLLDSPSSSSVMGSMPAA